MDAIPATESARCDDTGASVRLCTHLANLRYEDLPAEVTAAARRGVLDWLGCALAGSSHPTLDALLAVMSEVSGKAQATVFGRKLMLGRVEAAVVNGYMGHVLDYDDTHLGGTILHASSPVLAALFALAEGRHVTGRHFLLAYVCGFETGIRCGQAAPGHHAGGWHLTGTLGCLAAGVAAGKLLNLDPRRLTHALGIAATQAAGMQQNRGTMCKYLHAGKAASNGLLAGLLARAGFDSAADIIEGARGFSRIYSETSHPDALLDGLGTRWEITRNGYKPYACAAVLHPVIDSMREIHAALGGNLDADGVESIGLTVSPYVMSISGVRAPETGMQSKFSVFHTAAAALLDGDGGIAQYTDRRVQDRSVRTLRDKVRITIDQSLRKDQCAAEVIVAGRTLRARIEHALGTVDNPMSDGAIEAKFRANAQPAIGAERAARMVRAVQALGELCDLDELIALGA